MTWDRFFYFPSGGRHAEDFYVRKIQRLRSGLNPQTWVPEVSMLTTRPPKPSNAAGIFGINFLLARTAKLNLWNWTLTLHRKPNCNLVSEVQQDSHEGSYRRRKGTALSDSAAKDSCVDWVGSFRRNGKENLEDLSSPRKYEMPSEIVLNDSVTWLVRSM